MSSIGKQRTLKTHWRSLAELNDLPEYREFLEAEFPQKADPKGLNRRRWLQVMGASFALAGVAGCETAQQELLPFAKRPEDRTPGKTQRFATAMDLGGSAIGLLVTCVDGRPIKVEGNPDHPQSLGGSSGLAQAAILELYDPDRSRGLALEGVQRSSSWTQFDKAMQGQFAQLKEKQGAGLVVLAESNSSPTLDRLRRRLLKQFPQARWAEYEPLTDDNARAGATFALGKAYRTQLDLQAARVILCLDADLLVGHPASLRYARDFAKGREVVDGKMSRLYCVESSFSVTGVAADHRLPLRSSQIAAFLGRLERVVTQRQGDANSGHAAEPSVDKFLAAVAADLATHQGAGLIAIGPGQPPEVHAAAHRLNAALGNVGKTVRYTRDSESAEQEPVGVGHIESIAAVVKAMHDGSVDTLLILGGNPIYNAPADLDFAGGLGKVAMTIHAGLYQNETAEACRWHVPQAHFLESWGDARSYDGTYSVIQPMIEPLYGGRTHIEMVARLLGDVLPKPEGLVRETFQAIVEDSFSEKAWRRAVHDGVLADSAWPEETVSQPRDGSLTTEFSSEAPRNGALELTFCRDASVYDGRFANSGWLQECPDPLTKLTWDNAALVGPQTAKMLKVTSQTRATLQCKGNTLSVPVYVMPGQAEGSVAISLGYGRWRAGLVGGRNDDADVAPVGVNAYTLRTSEAMYIADGLKIEPTGEAYRLAVTQDHFAIDAVGLKERLKRIPILVREGSVKQYSEQPDFAQHIGHVPEKLESLWKEHEYDGRRWGMSIDLSKCIGCNACVVACQAENNVPVVGKDQVLRGREMHWIRIDRYFKGDPDHAEDVEVAMQPIACQQCELAPCEAVCPVAATTHSDEGLNDMVYNRCIGTRYCANNCPYKVRRFNYFNFHKDLEDANREVSKLMYNPEVTVRSRGVMEKCTYCVQRIQAAKIEAKNAGQPVSDGAVVTACQQACPSQAILFGDLADARSQVAHSSQDDRAYAILAELNIKPRTTYMAKIRNPNPDLTSESSTSSDHH